MFTALLLALLAPLALPEGSVVERDVGVPMRDGTRLAADVLRPAAAGRFPVLLFRTPYDRRRAPECDAECLL